MGMLQFCVILIVLGVPVESEAQNPQKLACNPVDLRALQGFMSLLESDIDGWERNSSSSSSSSSPNCCNWVGITCQSSLSLGLNEPSNYGRVIKLDLGKRRLNGKVSESIGNLEQLRTLNFSHNFFQGSLPDSLFHLPHLEILDLANNEFSGLFPGTPNLPAIQVLNVSDNSLLGPIPVGICKNSSQILVMKLGVNNFSGNIPAGLGDCTSLENLCVGANFLSGSLPDDLFKLPRLRSLTLQQNRFSGQLSPLIGNLSNLEYLDLCLNEFSEAIPDVFHSFRNLTYFSAHSNVFTGGIPLSIANSRTIRVLSLRNNSLSGTIDLNCSAMTSLESLDVANNQFHGPIPQNLPDCPRLRTVNLGRNNFAGEVPETFMNFQSLTSLSLSNSSVSNISSALRILQHCRNLTTLVLTLNFRDEVLPSDPNLQFGELRALVIANCRLTGPIPPWLRASGKLELLDLSWNRLEGTIPSWFGSFDSLFYLDLSNNSLRGDIPKELTGLKSLVSGNISFENSSLDFPFFVKRNVSLGGLQYNQIWSLPPTLELGNNFLTGEIWPEFGNMKGLHVFDLKCNNLSGTIPSTLSGMTSLETLDLSHNDLVGTIPPSLVNCSFLSKFSVAYNKLSGEIPTGGQFLTFMNSSFEGNVGLCGEHSTRSCEHTDNFPRGSPGKAKRRPRGSIIGMGIGIALGTIFLLTLMFLIVLRASSRRAVDPETEANGVEKELDELGSSLVIFFQNKDNDKETTLNDLVKFTDNFDQSNIVGCGGFGLVYKAILHDGRKVAIKRLTGEYGEMEREFEAEVEALSRAQHPNLVRLQGYCRYKNDRLLIYSYMENGSLDYWLHEKVDGPSLLNWDKRLVIAQGAARGLAYLHQACDPHILHRDIKSSNILLDENFEAHLADFGLARLIFPYDTHVTTDVVGTLGYIPPEYCQASVATYKGDVYSFGVVLLELLTSKRPMDMCKPKGSRDLISWVIQMKKEKRQTEVFDPFVYDKQHAEEMLWVLEIACLCLHECPKIRPSTQQLVSWLDNLSFSSGFNSG